MMKIHSVRVCKYSFLALLERHVFPRLERGLCCVDSVVHVLLARNWDVPEVLLGGRVDAVPAGGSLNGYAVDILPERGEV